MDDELLFIIPVYSMSEEDFQKKWDDFYTKKNFKNNEQFETIKRCYKNQWKYNQIIAYIEIYKSNGEINFVTYKSQQKNHKFNSSQHYYTFYQTLGQHFYVEKNMSHSEIVDEIRIWVDDLAKGYSKNAYIDYELFDKYIEHIDLHKIFYDK